MTRDELLTALKNARAEMENALAGLTEAQMTEPDAGSGPDARPVRAAMRQPLVHGIDIFRAVLLM